MNSVDAVKIKINNFLEIISQKVEEIDKKMINLEFSLNKEEIFKL